MTAAELEEGARIVTSFPLAKGGSILHYFTLEKREPDWLAEDGWWAVNGQTVTVYRDNTTRTGRAIDTPVSTLALEKFRVVE